MSQDERYKLFIGGLSMDTTEDSMRTYFEGFGTIVDVVVMKDRTNNRPRGFGFVSFSEENALLDVLAERSHMIDGKTVEVKKAVPRDSMPPSGGSSNGGEPNRGGRFPPSRRPAVGRVKKIFLGGLPPEATKEDITAAIEACSGEGTVREASVQTERVTEKPRGFGFAYLQDPHCPVGDSQHDERACDVVDRFVKEHPYVKVLDRDVEVKKAKSVDEMRTTGSGPRDGGPSSRQSGYPPSNYGGFGYGRGGDMPSMYGGSRGMGAGYYGGGIGYDPASYCSQPRRSDYPMGNPYSMYDRSGGAGYGYDSGAAYDYKYTYGSMMSNYANSSSGYGPTRGYGEYKDRSGGGDSRSFHPYSRR